VLERDRPDLALVYLPHLDYVLQTHGPGHERSREHALDVDAQAGPACSTRPRRRAWTCSSSRSTASDASSTSSIPIASCARPACSRPSGRPRWARRSTPGASRAFAVCDHQVAHVYVADPADVAHVAGLLGELPGVARVLTGAARAEAGLDHPRAGQVVLEAAPDAWFAVSLLARRPPRARLRAHGGHPPQARV
jgi:hypothetical protein